MTEETIYSLVKEEAVSPTKPPLFKSKFPMLIPPTYSTFGTFTTSRILGNPGGYINPPAGGHPSRSSGAYLGKLKGVEPRIKQRSMPSQLPEFNSMTSMSPKNPRVPKATDKPLMGLRTMKNYISSNKEDIKRISPKKVDSPDHNFLLGRKSKKVPEYINKMKKDREEETEILKKLQLEKQKEADSKMRMMSPRELQGLKDSLKNKWNEVNSKYQNYAHIKKPNTLSIKVKKEGLEKELEQLEIYMDKVKKPVVFVDATK